MNAHTDKLVADARILADDVEELLKATAAQTGEKISAARARAQAALAHARDTIAVRTQQTTQAADRYVHDNPWKSVGITAGVSAGIGLLVGLLLGRK